MMQSYRCQALEQTGLVKAVVSFRNGGVSRTPFQSLNLAEHVGDHPEHVGINRERFFASLSWPISRFLYCRQAHGSDIITIEPSKRGLKPPIADADAMISAEQGLALGVFIADCVPIFILDSRTPAIGIVHAGWRGTLARIVEKTVTAMQRHFGSDPAQCLAHLGPSIQDCCYTVSESLAAQFEATFGPDVRAGEKLDLHAANALQLIQAGVPQVNISRTSLCTACRTDLFFSHRAEGGTTGRMVALIGLAENSM